jgi:hypothetical protein
MKSNLKNIGLLFLASIALTSCSKDDNPLTNEQLPPSAATFKNIREIAIDELKQHFTATAGTGQILLTSVKGVKISIDGNALTKNGNPVTGPIDITFVELFDKGTMLITNRPTMGIMADGNHSLLKSGGEFFLKATQGGVDLATTAPMQMQVPADLTGTTADTAMTLWAGEINTEGNLAWREQKDAAGGKGGVGTQGNTYFVTFGNFGWTNVDRFYSDPRPKTTLLASVPNGYDNTNCSIYLSYDGEGTNALAKLDTYDSTTKKFSEHYGQIPIGLACHVIFVTEQNGQWRYAIKAVTVAANDEYNFTLGETTVGTEAQLVAAINAIQ